MSLRLICGRAGTGKSECCFNEIIDRLGNEKKIYIITPEQFSYVSEKKLLEKVKNGAVINAEVLSFARMAYRVANEVGGVTKTNLSACGKSMLIYKILTDSKNDLKFLGRTEENIDLINTGLTEFKKHKVSVQDLKDTMDLTEDKYLKAKLKDMITVYEKFENQIQNKYIDENDVLTILASGLDYTDMFKDTVIYIDEFTGFTKQEYEIIKKLLLVAKQVTVTICTDNLNLDTSMDSDLFFTNKKTADKILYIARSNNVECEKTIFLTQNYRSKCEELIHIEKNIYENLYTIYNKNVENIKLFLAANSYSEIENVAKQITKLVENENYRYRDIAVISKNLDSYSSLCRAIFNKYNIPVFIDEKKQLSQNMLIKYINSILEIFARNWSYETMFNYIKTGFLNIDKDDIYLLENYCLKWGIKGNKWYNSKWTYGEDEKNKEQIEKLQKLQNIIIEPLLKLKNDLSGTKTVESLTKKLYSFLLDNGIDKKVEQLKQKLEEEGNIEIANEQELAWDIVINVLDEMVLVFGEDKISFDKYSKLLKTGLNNSGLGRIPQTGDQVIVGDVSRSKTNKVKAIFIIGVNDGVYPSVNKDEGFFNDKDRQTLREQGIELAKTTIENIYEDNLAIYKVFSAPEEKIFISYSSSSLDGGTLRPSILITKIKKIFPKLREESDIVTKEAEILTKTSTFEELINKLRDFRDGKEIESIWFQVFNYYINDENWRYKLLASLKALNYINIPENITGSNIDKLYGNTLNTSVSRLEQYRACPFSYFLTYGLKITEKEQFQVQSIDTGNFMHETIDEFFTIIKENNLDVKQLDEEEIYKIIEEIINEKLHLNKNYIFTSTDKYKILAMRLKKVIFRSMKYIIESLKNSDFTVWGNELEFKKGKTYEPIILDLEKGKKVEITGKIDRIDIANLEDKKVMRIIDYKSSVKNIDLNEVVAGLQLQLLTYLDATCKIEELLPGGVLYFNLIDPIIKSDKSMTDEEIENEIRKKFKMQGLILADVKVVKMMDKTLEKGSSSIIPAYIDKDGNLSNSRSNCVSKEQFETLQKYTSKIIKEISEEILSGSIKIEPYYNVKNKKTPCKYCKYKSVCNFKAGSCGNKYNYILDESKQEIFERIKDC